MYKFNKIVVVLSVLIVFGISSCTNETPTPTSMQNQSNSQIATATDKVDNNQIAVTTGESKNDERKEIKNPKDPSIADINPNARAKYGSGCIGAYPDPECGTSIETGQPIYGYPYAISLLENGPLWGEIIPGYTTVNNFFINTNSQNPIITGWGIRNGGVKYPTMGNDTIYIWETESSQIYTEYDEWLNAVGP